MSIAGECIVLFARRFESEASEQYFFAAADAAAAAQVSRGLVNASSECKIAAKGTI